jgi:hypothetical protein
VICCFLKTAVTVCSLILVLQLFWSNSAAAQRGRAVRAGNTIIKANGTLPENQPTPQKSTEEIAREQIAKLKKSKEKLMLDE